MSETERTGYGEAVSWLQENAPEWRLQTAESRLVAGVMVGSLTGLEVTVHLVSAARQFGFDPDVVLIGEGGTMLEACENAVGGLK